MGTKHTHRMCSKRAARGLHCRRAHVEGNMTGAAARLLEEQGDGADHVAASAADLKAPATGPRCDQTYSLSMDNTLTTWAHSRGGGPCQACSAHSTASASANVSCAATPCCQFMSLITSKCPLACVWLGTCVRRMIDCVCVGCEADLRQVPVREIAPRFGRDVCDMAHACHAL